VAEKILALNFLNGVRGLDRSVVEAKIQHEVCLVVLRERGGA